MEVFFLNEKCIAKGETYMNGRKAIELKDSEGFPMAHATTNINEYLPEGSIFVKDYSENKGMVDALINAGIIYPDPTNTVLSGHVAISSYKLTDIAKEKLWPKS